MIDYSFIRYKSSFTEAKNIGDSPIVTHPNYECIPLSPNEAYLQITNVDGGIAFGGSYEAHVIDCSGIELLDITDKVFIEEFTDRDGLTQCSIEYINIGQDFYYQDVYFRIQSTISDDAYYSNPVIITDYNKEETIYLEYWNNDYYFGTDYTSADKKQSIRVKAYFDIPIDETEVQDYYQISKNRTISARALDKQFERYAVDQINSFTYQRLNKALRSENIYLDCVRVTNKVVIESSDRAGQSNFFSTNFTVSKNYNDTKQYEYQIFEGLNAIDFHPSGIYTLADIVLVTNFITFNYPVDLNTGTVTLYDSDNNVIDTFTESSVTTDANEANILDLTDNIIANGVYHVHISSGLFSYLGVDYEGINDSTTWTFTVSDGEYELTEYDNTQYFT